MRQVSPESIHIYELIMEIYRACGGDWLKCAAMTSVGSDSLHDFTQYAAVFLGNIGNYYVGWPLANARLSKLNFVQGRGDRKFIPRISGRQMKQLAGISARALDLYGCISDKLYAVWPGSLGFPSKLAQSSYYPGSLPLNRQEVSAVSRVMEANGIYHENTRISKSEDSGITTYLVLQASIETDHNYEINEWNGSELDSKIRLVRGDHSHELQKIYDALTTAQLYAANDQQRRAIHFYLSSFKSGSVEDFRESQRLWVKDIKLAVETQFGFVEPYRDPFGVRAEFEGLVACVDNEETEVLTKLVATSELYIRKLPWCQGSSENDGKGPFEKELFEPPDFTSLRGKLIVQGSTLSTMPAKLKFRLVLAYCSSIIFPGINLPNVCIVT